MIAAGMRAVDPALLDWAAKETGARISDVRIATNGASRLTAILELNDGATKSVVLRHDTGGGSLAGTPFSLEHEAYAYQIIEGRDITAPRLIALSNDGRSLLLEKAEGVVANAHEAFPDFLRKLGKLHALQTDESRLKDFASKTRDVLPAWKSIYQSKAARASPLIDMAFEILPDLQPQTAGPQAMCHGDPGAGNYLVQGERVTALLDWELSHLGDPMDDLAWITIRASQYGIAIDNFGALVAEHWAASSGLKPDQKRLRYWQAVGLLRMLIMCIAHKMQPRKGEERLLQMMIEPVLENQLIVILAELTGEALNPGPVRSAENLLAAFPAEELAEAAEDISETFLKFSAQTSVDPWMRRIRQLMRQVAERGAAFSGDFAEPAGAKAVRLNDLYQHSQNRLAWLPRATALAARPLATLTQMPCPSTS
jgi:aminoglycoside phosphotransferase (APT) family kinase protein